MEIKWLEKQNCRKYYGSDADVSISTTKNGIFFTFRNKCYAKITKSDYIKIAIVDNKIYFDTGDSKTGYKLYAKNSKKVNRYVHLRKVMKRFEGEYSLLWDSKEGYYYISTDGKENFKNV